MNRHNLVSLIVLLGLLFSSFSGLNSLVPPVQARADENAPLAYLYGLMDGWAKQQPMVVRNQASGALPAGYTVRYTLDTAALVTSGDLQADCRDLRITYGEDSAEVQLDRLVEGCNTSSTVVRFRTQASIPISGTDTHYHLYYGSASSGAAPANPASVYAYYDDFSDGNADGWNAAKGTWGVVNDGGNYIYRYTGGGANWALSYVPASDGANLEYTAKIRAATSTTWIGLAFRIQDANNFLTFYQSRDTNQFKYAHIAGDGHSIILQPGFVMPTDTWYNVKLQAVGTLVQARIWPAGSAEPSTWTISTTDALYQASGNFGLTLYVHNTAADWDDIQVRKLVDAEPVVENYQPGTPITTWYYRAPITIANNAAAALPVGYSVQFTLDTASLITAEKMQADCSDLRVGEQEFGIVYEIDRVVEGCNTADTKVWFALKRVILTTASDSGYFLYYGDPGTVTPQANGDKVFVFFEDWEKGAVHWTNAAGLDAGNTGTLGASQIVTEFAVSPANSQKFPSKKSGGDAFSGYIPVLPNTHYAISTWLRAGENTYVPVGFDPYTAGLAKGTEVWLWTNDTVGPAWGSKSAAFTTSPTTAYLKIKSEWWAEAPGTQPAFLDNLALRLAASIEPTLNVGDEQTTLVVPSITNITSNSPVNLGSPLNVSAQVSTSEGTIATAILRVTSPVQDIPMTLASGTNTSGEWQASYTPTQGGSFTYRIVARSSQNRTTVSPLQTAQVLDTQAPTITGLAYTNPILVRDTQTVTVNVTDNGALSSVNLTTGGVSHAMTPSGSQYSYTWRPTSAGTVNFTITAVDSANNQSQLSGTFAVNVRLVDVCTWKDCKVGAQSWSVDDGNSACRVELETAGLRGTYYYNGNTVQNWFADYSNAGHEVSSHTVGHPCNTPTCSPSCTKESLAAIPYTEADVTSYRLNQLEPNIAAIETGTNKPVLSLAWPCGCVDPGREAAASYYYLGARGYYDWVAQLQWVQDVNLPSPEDFYLLNSAASYDQTFIDRAISEGKWAIITSHGSCAGIDYMGTKKDVLWSATVGDVLKYIYVRDHAQLTGYSRVGRTISFQASGAPSDFVRQKLDGSTFLPITFDNPVTLKVNILESDTVLSVNIDGSSVPFTVMSMDGARFVVFDTPLNATHQVTVTLSAPAPTIGAVTDNSPVEIGQAAHVEAVVTLSEGSLQNVTLRVLTPQAADYPMSPVPGSPDTYAADFTPAQLGPVTYRITAVNDTGGSAQSTVRTLQVQDATPPTWRSQAQTSARVKIGSANTLSVEGLDPGGLMWATLETNESGAWQEFTFPTTDWWNYEWTRRVPVTLTETQGLARTAETLDAAVSSDVFSELTSCAELRVAGPDRVELPSQVYGETSSGGVHSCHLLFQTAIGANASKTIYIYYGNPTAATPSYTTDLTSSTASGTVTVHSSYFDLDLNGNSGIISRLRLPLGSNANLPLSPSSDSYWGWHQVCSTVDGNITGKNSLCTGGVAEATGLTLTTTLDGPVVKEYTLTSTKGGAVYTIIFRFFANTPSYRYILSRSEGSASVMNNFWYLNGSYTRLLSGSSVSPDYTFNSYSYGSDLVRIVSLAGATPADVDGQNNDGTDLGGTDYRYPDAAGLDLWVTTGASQAGLQNEITRVTAPLQVALGTVENAPSTQYGSPVRFDGAIAWSPAAFTWQNPAIPTGTNVQWRVKLCDVTGTCVTTSEMSFAVVPLNTAPASTNDSYSTDKNTPLTVDAPGVLANDTDDDSDPITAVLVTGPAHGTLALNANGSFTYSPAVAYHGADSFTYKSNDGSLDSSTATVTITVNNTSTPPRFTGTLHFDKNAPPAGSTLSIFVAGAAAPVATTVITEQGTYTVDVPVDLPGTPEKEGGLEGDVVTVSLNGRVLARGVWHSALNTQLDVYSHTVTLQSGWNLLSFTIQPADTSPEQVLFTIAGQYDLVYAWDANSQGWQKYAAGSGYGNTLNQLDERTGLWVHTSAPVDLQVVGKLPSATTIPLLTGWNLVSYPSSVSRPITGNGFTHVYAYHANDATDPWKIYDYHAPGYANDLTALDPGWGYWIKPATPGPWTVNYLAP